VIVDDLLLVDRIERALCGSSGLFLLLAHLLLRIHRRQQRALRSVGRLRLIHRLLLIAPTLRGPVTEQEFDEAAAHVGAFGVGPCAPARLRGRGRSRWFGGGVDRKA
jgi:hypothetical protein